MKDSPPDSTSLDATTNAAACMRRAEEAAARGDYAAVTGHLREAVRLQPFHLHANAHLAWLYAQDGLYRQAVTPLIRMLTRQPWKWEIHARLLQTLWFAFRKQMHKRMERSPRLRSLHNVYRSGLDCLGEGFTAILERSGKRPAIVSEWMRHNRLLRRAFHIYTYEYYKVSEIEFVARHVPCGSRVLDLGSGRSAFPSFLARRGCHVVVAELELPSLQLQKNIAASMNPERMQATAGNFLALPFADGTFDRVSIISSIEHVPGEGDVQAVRELARVVKPGGEVLITVPAGPQAQEQWTRHAIGHVYAEAEEHGESGFLRVYSPETLQSRLIEPSGLTLLERKFYGETTAWGWMGLGRNFMDHRRVLHPSPFAAPLNRLFSREIAQDELDKSHWLVACVRLRKE